MEVPTASGAPTKALVTGIIAQKFHVMFTGGAYFKEAPEATQVVFAYDGFEPYWT